jgi:LEA14-like dessication related protein
MSIITRFLLICYIGFLSACAMMNPKFENPTVKVAALKMLPTQGFVSQPIEITLLITNPNASDLNLRGISYTVGLEDFNLLSGASNNLPTLTAYQETPVKVVVTANIIQVVKFIQHLSSKGTMDAVNYSFDAKLDFFALLPALHVKEKGILPLKK